MVLHLCLSGLVKGKYLRSNIFSEEVHHIGVSVQSHVESGVVAVLNYASRLES